MKIISTQKTVIKVHTTSILIEAVKKLIIQKCLVMRIADILANSSIVQIVIVELERLRTLKHGTREVKKMTNSKTTKRLSDIPNGAKFGIVELCGYYTVNHQLEQAYCHESYDRYGRLVRGLYESLEAGRWTIK